MIERGILMTAENVRAMMDERKLESRRTTAHGLKTINLNPDEWSLVNENPKTGEAAFSNGKHSVEVKSRYGGVGTLLWVRETHAFINPYGVHLTAREAAGRRHKVTNNFKADFNVQVFADVHGEEREAIQTKWIPGIHMPRWASRIQAVRKVFRFERLHDISILDALDEGVKCPACGYNRIDANTHLDHGICVNKWLIESKAGSTSDHPAIEAFQELWERVNGPGSWDRNPWVEVVGWDQAEVRA